LIFQNFYPMKIQVITHYISTVKLLWFFVWVRVFKGLWLIFSSFLSVILNKPRNLCSLPGITPSTN
jgi:hypothetical protein